MAKGRGQKVNRTQLGAIFGKSLPTIDQWVRDGCPYDQKGAGKGRQWIFDTADVSEWLQSRVREEAEGDGPKDEKELKRRRMAVTLRADELDLAERLKLVAPVAEFERAQSKMNAVIRQNVMNVVERASLRLVGENDPHRFKEVLRAELADALQRAATEEIDFSDEDA